MRIRKLLLCIWQAALCIYILLFNVLQGCLLLQVVMASEDVPAKPKHSKFFVTACLAANVALSISIILLNKAVYTHVGFPNMTLTLVHFVFTTIGMMICRAAKLFVYKPLPMRQMVPVSITFCGFVVLTNLSLQSNTVGTYQIIKCMTTPVIIVIQTVFYARIFSTPVKLTLVSWLVFMHNV